MELVDKGFSSFKEREKLCAFYFSFPFLFFYPFSQLVSHQARENKQLNLKSKLSLKASASLNKKATPQKLRMKKMEGHPMPILFRPYTVGRLQKPFYPSEKPTTIVKWMRIADFQLTDYRWVLVGVSAYFRLLFTQYLSLKNISNTKSSKNDSFPTNAEIAIQTNVPVTTLVNQIKHLRLFAKINNAHNLLKN
jgi:hypothetical protein